MKISTEQTLTSKDLLGTLSAYYELTKPGITYMVLASMVVGFILGSAGAVDVMTLIHAAIGTYLIAAGTAAHNQFIERNLDKLMNRTSSRPLPSGRITPELAEAFSVMMIVTGLFYLIMMVNPVAGMVSAATTILYLGVYTPMKRRSFWNVIIGSVPGALPPVGGWAAASGSIADPGMWLLFGIVFCWQIPHVLSIAWLCNDDYCNAGFRMLPKGERKGIKTALLSVGSLLLLLPVTYLVFQLNIAGYLFLITGILAALAFLLYGIRFAISRSNPDAKKLMFASFFYLPIVWIAVIADQIIL